MEVLSQVSSTGTKARLLNEGDRTVLHHQANVEPVIDEAARMAQHEQHGTPEGNFKLAAYVPDIFYYTIWPNEFERVTGMTKEQAPKAYRDFFLAKLDLPEFCRFRVDPGRIGAKTDVGRTQVFTGVRKVLRGSHA